MTTAEMEQYIRDRWKASCINWFCRMEPKLYVDNTFRWFDSWKEFYDFTIAREEEIRQVEEEIEYVSSFQYITHRSGKREEHPVWKRILAREKGALDTLKRGMR